LSARGAWRPHVAHSAVSKAPVANQLRDALPRSGGRGMSLRELAGRHGLPVQATEAGILCPQGIDLTFQPDDAVTERGEASVHNDLPA